MKKNRPVKPVFFNRELNWLEFNQRVLAEALDSGVPVLERLKFLAITDSNLDEFFMVRVGGLQMLTRQGITTPDMAHLSPAQQLKAVHHRVRDMIREQHRCFGEDLEPLMESAGLVRTTVETLSDRQSRYLTRLFTHDIFPVVTPIGLDPGRPTPLLGNLFIHIMVRLNPAAGQKEHRFAVIPILHSMERFVRLPSTEGTDEGGDCARGYSYMLLEDVITAFIARLFPNEPVLETSVFKLTRNADMSVAEDGAADLLSQMEEVLDSRKTGDVVRLEVHSEMSGVMLDFLQTIAAVTEKETMRIPGPLRLSDFMRLTSLDGYDALRYESWPPVSQSVQQAKTGMFDLLAKKDQILFHPYDSFEPVQRLVEEAAADPSVMAIKQVLYRVSRNSPMVAALRRAAEQGKAVTVVVELKARFDEARNIEWARTLERAGAQVVYGVRGFKTHAKALLIVRREERGVVRYLHFGTGNYNESTARLYSDVSFFTCREELGADVSAFFNAVTGYSQPQRYQKLEAAPLTLRRSILNQIEAEAERSRHGQKTLIRVKVNSLADPEIIKALYKASQAGVRVQLNVRGVCCLVPGIKGLSQNITVVSIVDRFLEHARILHFHHGGDDNVFISSADWMPRNLDRRVELLVPVEDTACKQQLIQTLDICFADTVKAWSPDAGGVYARMGAGGAHKKKVRSQQALYDRAKERIRKVRQARRMTFEPHRSKDFEE